MKKSILAIAALIVMGAVVGCQGGDTAPTTEPTTTTTPNTTATTPPAGNTAGGAGVAGTEPMTAGPPKDGPATDLNAQTGANIKKGG